METNSNFDRENTVNRNFEAEYSFEQHDKESLKVMLNHFYTDIVRLYEKEKFLVRAEIQEKVADVKQATISVVVGGFLLAVGVLSLVATVTILLAQIMVLWQASVLVTAILLVVGGIFVIGAKKKLDGSSLRLSQTIETLDEVKTTIKERINEFKQYQH